jgi:ABC-type Na+ efflux pump permease subunit
MDDGIGVDAKPKPPIEGRIYGEISGWITILGIVIALIGTFVSLASGNSIFDYNSTVRDLFSGCREYTIWVKDTVFHTEPYGYWFISKIGYGDGLAMLGIAVAIYGGIVGMVCLFAAMFRSKEVLFYKKGLYTLLALLILSVMLFCAWRAEFAL